MTTGNWLLTTGDDGKKHVIYLPERRWHILAQPHVGH